MRSAATPRPPRFAIPAGVAAALERVWTGWRGPRRTEGNTQLPFLMDYAVQRHWGWKVAAYMYLSGASAGLVALEVLLGWLGAIDEGTARLGMVVGFGLSLLGILAVFDQLGPVARWNFHFALRRPRTSVVTRSVMLVLLLLALRLVVLVPGLVGADPWPAGSLAGDILRATILGVAIIYIVASAMIISSWNAIAFWNSPMVPTLFIGWSLLGGATALPLLGWVTGGRDGMASLLATMVPTGLGVLLADALLLGLYIQGMRGATLPARRSVRMLLHGAVRGRFLGGAVGLGLVVPALLLAVQLAAGPGDPTGLVVAAAVATAVAVQAGGYLLRDAILRVGVYGPPL